MSMVIDTPGLGRIDFADPKVIKAAGGLALVALGGKTGRMIGLGLLAWASWDYLKQPAKPGVQVIPYDPDAPLPLTGAQTSADPFKGTRWANSPLAPSVRPVRPGEEAPGGKVIPLRPPSAEDRAMFYGINPDDPSGNVG